MDESAVYTGFRSFFYALMPVEHFNHLHITNVGTNQISVRVEEYKAWITLLDRGNPQEPFFVLNKEDWEKVKSFIDSQLTDEPISIPIKKPFDILPQ